MDNLTHSLLAAALSKSRLGRLHRHAAAWLVVAANLPDLDVLAALAGRESYLVHHRGVSHALLGVALQVPIVAALVRFFDRRAAREPTTWRAALTLAGVALATHPLLDLLNPYGLRPWLPSDASWIYGDLVFIVDPWMWLVLGAAAALAGARSRAGSIGLALVATLGSVVIYGSGQANAALQIAWPIAAAAIAFLRASSFGRAHAPRVLSGAALVLGAYLATLALCRGAALERARTSLPSIVELPSGDFAFVAVPEPVDPRSWTILAENAEVIVTQPITLGGAERPSFVTPKHYEDPRVRAALESPCTAWWRSFARVGYAHVDESNGDALVRFDDARYSAAWCASEVLVHRDGTVACDFGAAGSVPSAPVRSAR